MHVPPCRNRVNRPSTLLSKEKRPQSRSQNRARRGLIAISTLSPPHDQGAQRQHAGRQREAQPETDILLGVDHGDLADQSANVDEHVEPVVNPVDGDGRIDNDLLPRRERPYGQVVDLELLRD